MAGWSYAVIASQLGYKDHTSALYAVRIALKKTLQEPAEHYRALTLERLTKVLNVWWLPMVNGDHQATDKVLAVITDIRALLGLDAPTKIASANLHAIIDSQRQRGEPFDHDAFAALFQSLLTPGGSGDGASPPDSVGEPLDTSNADT